jgi:hypothetical protein
VGLVAAFAFIAGIIGVAIALNARTKAKRQTALELIAHQLAGQVVDAGVMGARQGIGFALRFTTRGSGSSSVSWTEVDVDMPRNYPLSINVRRHGWLDRGRIERGDMIDVQLGDPAFDDAFLVECAPADVARILFDEPARRFIAHYDPIELTTEPVGDRRILRLAVRGWLEETSSAVQAVDGATRIGARVREAYAAAETAVPAREAGSPYRPIVDDQPVRDAAQARLHEVAEVERVKALREARSRFTSAIIFIVILVVIVSIWAASV